MARYLLRPFQDRLSGRTGYTMHEIVDGSERQGWTVKPEACGTVTPNIGRHGYVFRFDGEAGQPFDHVAHIGFDMCRRGNEMHVAT